MKYKKKTIITEENSSKNKKRSPIAVRNRSDVDDIRDGLKKITSDDKLFMQTLIDAGIYDKNRKLTKTYR